MNSQGGLKEAVTVEDLAGEKPNHHKYRDESKTIADLMEGNFN
jgi:hypothetical protein